MHTVRKTEIKAETKDAQGKAIMGIINVWCYAEINLKSACLLSDANRRQTAKLPWFLHRDTTRLVPCICQNRSLKRPTFAMQIAHQNTVCSKGEL